MSLCILNILFQLATVCMVFVADLGKKSMKLGKNKGYFELGTGEKFGPTRKAENPLAFIPVHFRFSSSSTSLVFTRVLSQHF